MSSKNGNYYMEITKICTKCKKELSLIYFRKHSTGKYGRNSVCKSCESERVVQWQRDNPDKVRARAKKFADKPSTKLYKRNWMLNKNYDINQEDVDSLLILQDNACAICKRTNVKLHVDHCHSTQIVRGLLCGQCNKALGLLQDNPEIVEKAAKYLMKHQK